MAMWVPLVLISLSLRLLSSSASQFLSPSVPAFVSPWSPHVLPAMNLQVCSHCSPRALPPLLQHPGGLSARWLGIEGCRKGTQRLRAQTVRSEGPSESQAERQDKDPQFPRLQHISDLKILLETIWPWVESLLEEEATESKLKDAEFQEEQNLAYPLNLGLDLSSSTLNPKPFQVCLIMNKLANVIKRADRRKEETKELLSHSNKIMAALSLRAAREAGELMPKNIAWALNAVKRVSTKHDGKLYSAAADRLQELQGEGFGAQNLALIANAYAYIRQSYWYLDAGKNGNYGAQSSVWETAKQLVSTFRALALEQDVEDWISNPQALANYLNAVTRLGLEMDAELVELVEDIITSNPQLSDSPHTVALLANSLATQENLSSRALNCLSFMSRDISQKKFDPQSISLLLNAFSKTGTADHALFTHLSQAALNLPRNQFSIQSIANILHAFAITEYFHRKLCTMFLDILLHLEPSNEGLRPQHVANFVQAFSRFQEMECEEELFSHLWEIIRVRTDWLPSASDSEGYDEDCTAQNPKFKSSEIATVVSGFARVLDTTNLSRNSTEMMYFMCQAAEGLDTSAWNTPTTAIFLSAMAKCGVRREQTIQHLSVAIQGQELGQVPLQDASLALFSLASLGATSDNVIEHLIQRIIEASDAEFSMLSVANIAWATAALDLSNPELHTVLKKQIQYWYSDFLQGRQEIVRETPLDILSSTAILDSQDPRPTLIPKPISVVSLQEIRQVHQYILSRKFAPEHSGPKEGRILDPSQERICCSIFEARSRNRAKPSQLQAQVEKGLTDLGFKFVSEAIDSCTGYGIDILLHSPEAKQFGEGSAVSIEESMPCLAIEVDGPLHYALPDRRESLGSTVLKHRQLRRAGWKLVSIPFWDWNRRYSWEERRRYLEELLMAEGDEIWSLRQISRSTS